MKTKSLEELKQYCTELDDKYYSEHWVGVGVANDYIEIFLHKDCPDLDSFPVEYKGVEIKLRIVGDFFK